MSNELQKLIEAFPGKHWNLASLSENPNITMDFVKKHSTKHWVWDGLSKNGDLTLPITPGYFHMVWMRLN